MNKLPRDFFDRNTLLVAEDLVGKIVVRKTENNIVMARISETEAYVGETDKACHCYGGRITERTKVMFSAPGTAYVYMIYGMYYCFNVVTEKEGTGSAVLIRSGLPAGDINIISGYRFGKEYDSLSSYQKRNFLNGPGKLAMGLKIDKKLNGTDLSGDELFIADDGYRDFKIEKAKRVNINYAEEARDFLWRNILVRG